MEEFEAQVSRALHLVIEAVAAIATETQQNLEALGQEAQGCIDGLLEQGEAQVQEIKTRTTAPAESTAPASDSSQQ